MAYGSAPWAGTSYPSNSLLPTFPPFDVFCLGPCGSLLTVTLYPEVSIGPGGQWDYDPSDDAIHMWSSEETTFFTITTGIPDEFSVEWRLRFSSLPEDFSDLNVARVHVGVGSHQGMVGGLAFSEVGVAFVPDPLARSAQPLPASAGLIEPEQTYIIRLVVTVENTYIYITRYADVIQRGHALRYVVPSVRADSLTNFTIDGAWALVKGATVPPLPPQQVSIRVGEFCVSSSLFISDYPPVADPGFDQAVQFCSIARLDGSKSIDPQGFGLSYIWRMIDVPDTSGFCISGLLGSTEPSLTGYTDKLYCSSLGEDLPTGENFIGDVLVVDGAPYDILALGSDFIGDYIQITLPILPAELSLQAFKIIRQFGITAADSSRPGFYPDVPGFYKFELVVSNGILTSQPATVVLNVVSTTIPRGCTPNLNIFWKYLSDFWKLVDDKQRYEVVWSGLAQFAASELLNLWQYEYAKSLRDIQRTFQRRWLSYSCLYSVPRTLTSIRSIFSSVDFLPFPSKDYILENGGDPLFVDLVSRIIGGFAGATLTFTLPTNTEVSIFLALTGNIFTFQDELVALLARALPSSFSVHVSTLNSQDVFLRITATHPFSVVATAPMFAGSSSVSASTSLIYGSQGVPIWGGNKYKVESCLSDLGIVENDFLEVGNELYRIVKLESSGGGTPNDVLVLKDDLPDGILSEWSIPSYARVTGASFYNELVSAGDDLVLQVEDGYTRKGFARLQAMGAASADGTVVAFDASSLGVYLFFGSAYTYELSSVYRRTFIPIDDLVVDVPYLQETITAANEGEILRRNLDFFIETYRGKNAIRFAPGIWVHDEGGELVVDPYPPASLWAEMTYLDNRPSIESNFGIPAGFTLEQHGALDADIDYLSAVRGLWYSYFQGPRLGTLRAGAQILLGLPFSEEDGIIEEIRDDFSPNTSRILIRDVLSTELVRSYSYPRGLGLEVNPATGVPYVLGDTAKQFAPLVKGVELVDYISDNSWINVYASQGGAYGLQRFFRFLIRVDYGAFNLAALLFVREFILKVKPTYTFPIFSVLLTVDDATIDITDTQDFYGIFNIFDSPSGGVNVATIFDQPEDGCESFAKIPPVGPIGSVWKNSYDCGYSARAGTVDWAHDKLSPAELLECIMTIIFPAPAIPTADSIFGLGFTMYDVAVPGVPLVWDYQTQLPAGAYYCEAVL